MAERTSTKRKVLALVLAAGCGAVVFFALVDRGDEVSAPGPFPQLRPAVTPELRRTAAREPSTPLRLNPLAASDAGLTTRVLSFVGADPAAGRNLSVRVVAWCAVEGFARDDRGLVALDLRTDASGHLALPGVPLACELGLTTDDRSVSLRLGDDDEVEVLDDLAVRLTVTDRAGHPIAGASASTSHGREVSDGAGHLALSRADATDELLDVTVSAKGFAPRTTRFALGPTVLEGAVVLDPGGELIIRVDAPSSELLVPMTLEVHEGEGVRFVRTTRTIDAPGTYSFAVHTEVPHDVLLQEARVPAPFGAILQRELAASELSAEVNLVPRRLEVWTERAPGEIVALYGGSVDIVCPGTHFGLWLETVGAHDTAYVEYAPEGPCRVTRRTCNQPDCPQFEAATVNPPGLVTLHLVK